MVRASTAFAFIIGFIASTLLGSLITFYGASISVRDQSKRAPVVPTVASAENVARSLGRTEDAPTKAPTAAPTSAPGGNCLDKCGTVPLVYDIDLGTGVFQQSSASDSGSCCGKCMAADRCKAFSFDAEGRKCFLKEKQPNRGKPTKNYVSGVKTAQGARLYDGNGCPRPTKQGVDASEGQKISVLLMNYNRPDNVELSLPALHNMSVVDQIIVLNGLPEHRNRIEMPKVVNVDDSEAQDKWATMRRFMAYKHARNEILLHLDDDQLPTEQLLHRMLRKYQDDPRQMYGSMKYARLCDSTGYNAPHQNAKNKGRKLTNFVLTGVSLMSKSTNIAVLNGMKQQARLFKLVLKQKGNGEDLLFNDVFIKLFRKFPVAVHGDVLQLDGKRGFASSAKKGKSNHYAMRGQFCKLLAHAPSESWLQMRDRRPSDDRVILDILDGQGAGETPKKRSSKKPR
jgi:hypothetical protein